jgi:hypothetical protein
VQDKQKKMCRQKYTGLEKITKEHLYGVVVRQASSWSLRNLNVTQKELKRFMMLRYLESLNEKAWQNCLINKNTVSNYILKSIGFSFNETTVTFTLDRLIVHRHICARWIKQFTGTSIFCFLKRTSSVLSYS